MHQLGALCDIHTKYESLCDQYLWPGGTYTDATHRDKAKIMIPYSDEIVNHDYIGSFGNAKWAKK